MTQVRRLASILCALMFVMTVTPAAAQQEEESVLDDPSQLEGIEAGVARAWYSDRDLSTPPAEGESLVYIAGGAVLEFDTGEHATAAYGTIREFIETEDALGLGATASDLEIEELDDLGDSAVALSGSVADATVSGYLRYILVQDGTWVYYTVAMSTDADAASIADDIVAHIDAQDDDASGVGEVNENGGSTGGLWDLLPDPDDDLFEGMVPGGDNVLYPVEDGEA